MRLLIIYASQAGSTEQIAHRIARQMADEGLATDLYNVAENPGEETEDEHMGDATDWDCVDDFALRFASFIRSCKQPPEKCPRLAARWV